MGEDDDGSPRAEDGLLCCCGSGRPGCCCQHRFFPALGGSKREGAQLCRAASGTRVCPFILTAGTLGNSRGKFHFYSCGTWGLYFYFILLFFFRHYWAPALSPSLCCTASSEAEVIFSANAMISLSANDPRTVSKINEPNLLILLTK